MHSINIDGRWSNFDTVFLTGKTDRFTKEVDCVIFASISRRFCEMSENVLDCKVYQQFEVEIWTILTYFFCRSMDQTGLEKQYSIFPRCRWQKYLLIWKLLCKRANFTLVMRCQSETLPIYNGFMQNWMLLTHTHTLVPTYIETVTYALRQPVDSDTTYLLLFDEFSQYSLPGSHAKNFQILSWRRDESFKVKSCQNCRILQKSLINKQTGMNGYARIFFVNL
jgi:hypothetical protein